METKIERVARAILEAERQYDVLGTSKNKHSYGGQPYKIEGPWFVVDTSTAEPDVNWPGELIEQFEGADSHKKAWSRKYGLVARAAVRELMAMDAAMLAAAVRATDTRFHNAGDEYKGVLQSVLSEPTPSKGEGGEK